MRFGIGLLLTVVGLFPTVAFGQSVHQDLQEVVEAEVVAIEDEFTRDIHGTDTSVDMQIVRAELRSGSRAGEEVTFENELTPVAAGDRVYLNYLKTINGDEYFTFKDFKRQPQLGWLLVTFVGLLLLFAGWQGVRSLLSLGLSVAAIFLLLVPALLNGYDPALVSLGIAALILAAVLFITHGVNARSLTAFAGTMLAVVVTCGLAWFWVNGMRLTGFGDDTAVYLNFSTNGTLDFAGLLLGSIIIGILGVLDDVSITQASVVQELRHANPSFSVTELYRRAIRVGRDHVGSLVNTLAFAYVGVSLPLVLLFANAQADIWLTLNQEIVAAEILRIIVGSIGLILAVPFTTFIAAWYFSRHEVDEPVKVPCSHGHHY